MLQKAVKVIQILKSVSEEMSCPIKPVIGGSVALSMVYGEFRKPHDVDIIVHTNNIDATQMLIKMTLEYVINKQWWSSSYYNDPTYFLNMENTMVNIIVRYDADFYDYKPDAYTINDVDIAFEDISTILDCKASWKREKDLKDLKYIEKINNLKKEFGYE